MVRLKKVGKYVTCPPASHLSFSASLTSCAFVFSSLLILVFSSSMSSHAASSPSLYFQLQIGFSDKQTLRLGCRKYTEHSLNEYLWKEGNKRKILGVETVFFELGQSDVFLMVIVII